MTKGTTGDDIDQDALYRLVGLMEWPDFNASVFVTGHGWTDGSWNLVERKLVTGLSHTPWTVRFGMYALFYAFT